MILELMENLKNSDETSLQMWKIVKFVIGVILMLISLVLSWAVLATFSKTKESIKDGFSNSTSQGLENFIGILLAIVGIGALVYHGFEFGIKLMRPLFKNKEEIEDVIDLDLD